MVLIKQSSRYSKNTESKKLFYKCRLYFSADLKPLQCGALIKVMPELINKTENDEDIVLKHIKGVLKINEDSRIEIYFTYLRVVLIVLFTRMFVAN